MNLVLPEEWRSIGGWPYEVSNHGRVRRSGRRKGTAVGRVLRPMPDHKGYLKVDLRDMERRWTTFVHTLAAAAFLGPKPTGFEVNHKDGDKRNSRVSNLEYVTPSENMKHAIRSGLVRPPTGLRSKLSPCDVRRIKQLRGLGWGQREIAAAVGISKSYVCIILKGHEIQRWQ